MLTRQLRGGLVSKFWSTRDGLNGASTRQPDCRCPIRPPKFANGC